LSTLFDPGIFSVEGLAGEILPGSTLGWFVSGTSTPLATYSDQGLTTPNPNPVTNNADGRFPPIWLQDQAYKMVLTLPDGSANKRDPVRDPVFGRLPSFAVLAGSDAWAAHSWAAILKSQIIDRGVTP
jgi:hypothetical protein